ncbi:PTS glucose transporter subunit IIA [Erysipelothrix sp. D19-032]
MYKDEVTETPVMTPEINADALHDTLVAPMDGRSVALSTVNDAMFSQEILGQGVGIIPSSNEVYAPVAGVISAAFETKHAIGITDDAGVEILIHVGIDTVQMGGSGFAYHVEKDARIEKGDHLMSLSIEAIQEHGYDPTTMMVITNSDKFRRYPCYNRS